MTARIKDWKKFQHYKNRRPPWIRLYRDILDDPDFYEMSGDDFKLLAMLWLIASEDPDLEGKLPASKTLAFRLRISGAKLGQALKRLNHWIIDDASNVLAGRKQDATPDQIRGEEIREEGEAPKKTKKKSGPLSGDWKPNGKHHKLAKEHGINLDWEADKFRDHALAKDWKMKDWDATFRNWLRKSLDFSKNGAPPSQQQTLDDIEYDEFEI